MCNSEQREASREEKKNLIQAIDDYVDARVRAELDRREPSPHKHDHDYFHDDCGLCQMEKDEQEKQQISRKEKFFLTRKRKAENN